MIILELPDFFRKSSPDTYPPFKNGRYMEEYFYDYIIKNLEQLRHIDYVYIPVFWTNLQVSSDFESKRNYYNDFLKEKYIQYEDKKFFTIVQHDDCVLLNIPKDTLIFGACSGHVPLPLIYEDTSHTLSSLTDLSKNLVCSFIGSETHNTRTILKSMNIPNFYIHIKSWTPNVPMNDIQHFLSTTKRSIFTLAPRGYGRNSFRFFECFLLRSIPVYVYDDVNWLPYQDKIDYSKFSIVIHENDLPNIDSVLQNRNYEELLKEVVNHAQYFTLDYMCTYIIDTLNKNNIHILHKGKQSMTFL